MGGTSIEERYAPVWRPLRYVLQILVVNETSSSVKVLPTRQGPCSDSARRGPTPEAISKTPWLWSAGAIGRKLLWRTLASAGRGQRARLRRGRDFVDSSIPRGSTEPTSGGRVCQPDLTVANFFANSRKRLTEHIFPSPLAWGFWLGDHPPGDQCPTMGPEGWLRPTVYCQCSKVMFHGGVLREFGVVAR